MQLGMKNGLSPTNLRPAKLIGLDALAGVFCN